MRIITIILLVLNLNCYCSGGIHLPNYKEHECKRKCVAGQTKICHYEFTLESVNTMQPDCMDCPKNQTDCFNYQCIVGKGSPKYVLAFNRMIPGPSIEVCAGDTISVILHNELFDQTTTIHWHGMHQRGTPYMDGVPMVTQCPISCGTSFNYTFVADPEGTHFYHSHSGLQRDDGAYGPLIVRIPVVENLYDYDLPEHVMMLTDWYYSDSSYHFNRFYRLKSLDTHLDAAIVLNGIYASINNSYPIYRCRVQKGLRYRFRIIQGSFTLCPMKIQVQGHNMTAITNYDQPETFDTIFLTAGERIDFIINANQSIGSYWIKITGYGGCAGVESLALLEYNDSHLDTSIKAVRATSNVDLPEHKKLNCIDAFPNDTSCISYFQMKGSQQSETRELKEVADFKYFFGVDKYNYVQPEYAGVNDSIITTTALNNITWKYPKHPFIFTGEGITTCNRENRQKCDPKEQFCECIHMLELPENSTIEFIIVDEGSAAQTETHPMHLHGHSFRIIGQERLNSSTTIEYVKELDRKNLLIRNLNYPPYRDSVQPPTGGYTIIRFYTNNPGYWFFHCHIERHTENGMAILLKVGKITASPPNDYTVCGNPRKIFKLRK